MLIIPIRTKYTQVFHEQLVDIQTISLHFLLFLVLLINCCSLLLTFFLPLFLLIINILYSMKEQQCFESISPFFSSQASSFSKTAQSHDHFPRSNFYIPTLAPKKYNHLKIRELIVHKRSQKENFHFRKQLNLPFQTLPEKLLGKQLSYNCFKPLTYNAHPSFTALQLKNRRTNEFYNCKKKSTTLKQSMTPFITENADIKRYEDCLD